MIGMIPKELRITAMRLDVINYCRWHQLLLALAFFADHTIASARAPSAPDESDDQPADDEKTGKRRAIASISSFIGLESRTKPRSNQPPLRG
jgi:hypothetical protein